VKSESLRLKMASMSPVGRRSGPCKRWWRFQSLFKKEITS
jgi:hypothetical protein